MMKTMKTMISFGQTWSSQAFFLDGSAHPAFFHIFSTGSKTSAGAESLAAPVATAAVGGWVSRQQAVHASVEHSYGSYGLWNEKHVWFQEYNSISYTVCIYLWSISDFRSVKLTESELVRWCILWQNDIWKWRKIGWSTKGRDVCCQQRSKKGRQLPKSFSNHPKWWLIYG